MSLPLAEQFRPQNFDQIVGQDHLLGKQGLILSIIKKGRPLSIILWGPPGCGKTSLARLYAKAFNMRFESLSAVFSGIPDLRKLIQDMERTPLLGRSLLLFVDEIHRFNKAQQDAFLPYLENGSIILVGATAENPSFYLNNALLSRTRVLQLKPLDEAALEHILINYEKHHSPLLLEATARQSLIDFAQGDGRYLLNLVENLEANDSQTLLTTDDLQHLLQKRSALFDKSGDQHYNLISALHKSVRGSDPDASLYWLARMLEAGEDPLFIIRRIIRIASEDVGLADPQALALTIAAREAFLSLGSPEGELALAQATVYLALAPKSCSIYSSFNQARLIATQTSHLTPPVHLINAATKMMKQQGYGQDYQYNHQTPHGFSGQNYFPQSLKRTSFYQPVERGFEREMKKRLDYFNQLREQLIARADTSFK
jgi:putative ATPase